MTYRVIQWATGAMGKAVLRTLLDNDDIDVVGALVYSEEKSGTDIGTLARRDETGVFATNRAEDILALDADVVVHAARLSTYGSHDDEIIALLESGKNVLSINGYSHPAWQQGERLARLEAACQGGGVSLMGVGLNPGFIGEQAAMVAAGLSTNIEHIEINEAVDAREIRDPHYFFEILGFGANIEEVDPNDPGWGPVSALNGMYEESLAAMAHHLGVRLDRVETDHVLYPAVNDIEVAAGTLRAGTVGHTNWRWRGIIQGRALLTLSIHWFAETAHLGQAEPKMWQVSITGQPDVEMQIELTKNPNDRSRMGAEQYALGAQVLYSIEQVVAAPPGVTVRPPIAPARLAGLRGLSG